MDNGIPGINIALLLLCALPVAIAFGLRFILIRANVNIKKCNNISGITFYVVLAAELAYAFWPE